MRTKLLVIFAALAVCAAASKAFAADPKVMDKIICAIENNTITIEEMEVEKSILQKAHDSLMFPGQEDKITNTQVMEELISRRLFLNTATRMGFSSVDSKIVDEALDAFRKAFSSPKEYEEFLHRNELKDSATATGKDGNGENAMDVDYRFRNVAIVKKFVAKKLDLEVKIGIETQFPEKRDQLAAQYPGLSEDDLKKKFEKDLHDQKLLEWVWNLTERTKVIILADEYRTDIENYFGQKLVKDSTKKKKR